MKLLRALGALLTAAVLAGCSGSSGVCTPKPVALLNTAFPGSEQPIVPSTMNGTRVDMLIDTGAQFSSVEPRTANKLNLPVAGNKSLLIGGAGGSIFTSVATVHNFNLGASHGTKILLPVLGLANRKLPDGHHLGGLIGNDILRYYDLDMDLPAQQIFLVDTSGCNAIVPWNGTLHPLPLGKAANGSPEVPVTIDGHKLTAIIDTGASDSLISPYMFRASGLAAEHPHLIGTHTGFGVGHEKFAARFYRFTALTIGGVVWHHPIIGVGGNSEALGDHLLLGDNFTAHHEIYISNTTGQVFVR